MTKFETIAKNTWVFVAAAALIAGSSSAMALTLDRNVPESVSANAVRTTTNTTEYVRSQSAETKTIAEYTVIDLSKAGPERMGLIREKLSKIPGITPEGIEEKYNEIISNLTPGDKDISAQQAAAYAADILKKAYGADFKGYTAEASFSKNAVPNSDNWTVVFRSPEAAQNKDQNRIERSYIASVNSVNGTMLDAGFYDNDYTTHISRNLKDPAWIEKAEQVISVLLPENVSISSSKVVLAMPEAGVTVVCELSDGSAYAVRLTGDNKEAAAYIYFPNGYDGSLDYKPLTDKTVG